MEEYLYPHFYQVENTHWWFVARREILLHYCATRGLLSHDTRLLDVGCGTGANLEAFAAQCTAAGLDASPHAIEFCRKRGLERLFLGTLDSFPDDQRFDLITLLDVAEHADDDARLLRAALQRLDAGGKLLLTVPAFPSLWGPHDVQTHHKRRYTKNGLGRLMNDSGFSIRHLTFFNTFLFPVAVARRFTSNLRGSQRADDLDLPSPVVNRILMHLFLLEKPLVPRMSLPFGLSLLCLAEKRT
jgi:SAM-dependent methyltransferase